jgi:hypothetical protein
VWSRSEFAKFILEHERRLIEALYEGFKPDTPEPRPPRPEPPEPKKLRQSELPGVDMNDLLRSISKPRPPRSPGQQQVRSNGRWAWWS